MDSRFICKSDIDYLARKERSKDLLREVERDRLIQAIRLRQPVKGSRIGPRLVELAAKCLSNVRGLKVTVQPHQ